jgi:hypothetical protein
MAIGTAMLTLAPSVRAQGIPYHAVFGQGYASDGEVKYALGRLPFSMRECRNEAIGLPHRSVRIDSSDQYYEDRRIIETVLYWAALYAWRTCPLHVIFAMTQQLPQLRYEITAVELYLPDGQPRGPGEPIWLYHGAI